VHLKLRRALQVDIERWLVVLEGGDAHGAIDGFIDDTAALLNSPRGVTPESLRLITVVHVLRVHTVSVVVGADSRRRVLSPLRELLIEGLPLELVDGEISLEDHCRLVLRGLVLHRRRYAFLLSNGVSQVRIFVFALDDLESPSFLKVGPRRVGHSVALNPEGPLLADDAAASRLFSLTLQLAFAYRV